MKKSKIPDLCVGCHEKVKQQLTSKRIHPPFEEECLLCHNPHSSKEKHLLVQTPPDLCFNCHDDFRISKKKSLLIHKPVEDERSCLNCHSPHASSEYRFLLKKEKQLCLSCHNKSIKTESRVIKNINQLLKSSKIIHGAIEGDGCVVCHSPHASTNPFLLVDVFPDGAYTNGKPENFSLCFNCHDSQMLTKEITTTATGFRKGDKNLHFVHINREKGRVCINCHNVHASKNEHLIATKVKFGNWEMPLKYIVNENGGSCSPGCHEKREYER